MFWTYNIFLSVFVQCSMALVVFLCFQTVLNDVGYACLCLNVSTASLHFCSSIHLLICSTIVVIDDCAVYTVLSLCTSFWAAWFPRHQPIICSGTVSPGPSRAGHSGLQSPLPSAGQTALQTAQPWVDLLTLSSFCPYFLSNWRCAVCSEDCHFRQLVLQYNQSPNFLMLKSVETRDACQMCWWVNLKRVDLIPLIWKSASSHHVHGFYTHSKNTESQKIMLTVNVMKAIL